MSKIISKGDLVSYNNEERKIEECFIFLHQDHIPVLFIRWIHINDCPEMYSVKLEGLDEYVLCDKIKQI